MEGETITMQDIYLFRRSGRGDNGEVRGEFVATGMRPKNAAVLEAAGIDLATGNFLNRGSRSA
jgi:pilus assembly protein CpaF